MQVTAKAMEVLDYKTTKKTFFEERKLHVQPHRPLTPEKTDNIENVPGTGINQKTTDEVDDAPNKIKEAVSNINKLVETQKGLGKKLSTQVSFSSARKPSLDRHKSFIK